MSKLKFGIEASQAVAENFKIFFDRLVRGYKSVTGRDPEGLDLLKIQLEAGEKARESAKVISMTDRTTINPSKGIMGGQQIKDSPEFGQKIRETYDAAKGPGKGQEMVDALKSPGAQSTKSIMEDQLGMKLYGDETFEEILQIQKTGVHPRGTPKEGFGEALKKFFGKSEPRIDSESLKKALMKTDNPVSDLIKTTEKGPKTLQQRRKEAEEALKNKNVIPFKDPDKKADGGRAGFIGGGIAKGLAQQIIKKYKGKIDDKLLNQMLVDDNPQRLAEVMATIDEALIMQNKGMGSDEIIGTIKSSLDRKKQATGGRIGFDMGGAPSIVLNPDEREAGKVFETDKVEDAIKEIIKRSIGPLGMAEIPLTKKGRLRFGFDGLSDKQISGGLDLLGGELNFGAGEGRQGRGVGFEFKKKFADGGRIGLKDGMSRRKFMKIMGGLAALPIVGKFFKGAKPAAKVADVVTKSTGGQPPSYFFDLADKIKKLGKVTDGPQERVKIHSMPAKDGKSELMLTEDISTGEMQIKKIGKEGDELTTEVQTMEYTPGLSQADETTKRIPADQYDEYTEINSRIIKDEFNEPDIIEGINVEDIVKEVKDQAQPIKKASGGVAMMLGE